MTTVKKGPFTAYQNEKRFRRAILECGAISAVVPFAGIMLSTLSGSILPLGISMLAWPAFAASVFLKQRGNFRFQVAEKNQRLLVGPGYTMTVGPGHWWKYRAEDIKSDNKFFTGLAEPIKVEDTLEGKDTGNRINFCMVAAYNVVDGERYNGLGSAERARELVIGRIFSDFKTRFCYHAMRGTDGKLLATETVLDNENTVRSGFAPFLNELEADYLSSFGIQIDLGATRLENIDYDEETKALRREVARKLQLAKAERQRQDTITEGVADPRLALAADSESSDVTVTAFELDIVAKGDPDIAKALAESARAVAGTGIAQNILTPKGKGK